MASQKRTIAQITQSEHEPHFNPLISKRVKLPDPSHKINVSLSKLDLNKKQHKLHVKPLEFFSSKPKLANVEEPDRQTPTPYQRNHSVSSTGARWADSIVAQQSVMTSKSCSSFLHPEMDSQLMFGDIDAIDVQSNQASLRDLCDQFSLPLELGFFDEINHPQQQVEPLQQSSAESNKMDNARFIDLELSQQIDSRDGGITFDFGEFVNRPQSQMKSRLQF